MLYNLPATESWCLESDAW